MQLHAAPLMTPIGELWCVEQRQTLIGVGFSDRRTDLLGHLRRHLGPATVEDRAEIAATESLRRYFAGDLTALDDIEVTVLGTEFQRAVWHELRHIRPGTTRSYGELAARIGRPAAVRAVGAANGANPVPVVLPCHRVIGQDGSLTGYGGGLDRKRWLLAHEGAAPSEQAAQQSLPL